MIRIKIKIKITTYSIDVKYLLSTWRYTLASEESDVAEDKLSYKYFEHHEHGLWTQQPGRYSLLEVTIVMTLEADVINICYEKLDPGTAASIMRVMEKIAWRHRNKKSVQKHLCLQLETSHNKQDC